MNVSYSIYDELIVVTWVTDEEDVYMNVAGASMTSSFQVQYH